MARFYIDYNEDSIDGHIDSLEAKYENFIEENYQWIEDLHELIRDNSVEVSTDEFFKECKESEREWLLEEFKLPKTNFKVTSLDDNYRLEACRLLYDNLTTEQIQELCYTIGLKQRLSTKK